MPRRDTERIEEEIAGVERPPRPRGLSSDYLQQAAEAFHAAGDPAHLYRHWASKPQSDQAVLAWMHRWAREERFKQARTCVLFVALAAEAYVNEFLAASELSRSRVKTLDNLSTVKKYTDGTAEAFGARLFRDGDEVMPKLEKLFKLRHQLAHPKPGFGPPGVLGPSDPTLDAKFAMPELAAYIVFIGGAAEILVRRAYGYDTFDASASMLWFGRDAVFDFASRRHALPKPHELAESSIWKQVAEAVRSGPRDPDLAKNPDLSINRLRAAKAKRKRT